MKEAYPVVIRDWRRAMRGASLRLGAISDGVYNIYAHKDRIVLEMPPLRARWLARTRAVIDRRYGDAPVTVRLSRLTRPKLLGRPAVVPVRGEPLHCPGGRLGPGSQRWNVKQIVGMHIRVADRIARHHGCTVKALIIDGMGQGGTSDFSHDRINVVMRGKRVVRILGLA